MAIIYNAKTGKIQKNCNCGGPLPVYEPVIFKYGGPESLNDSEFTRMISKRRKEERGLEPQEQAKFRSDTAALRAARKQKVESARALGFTFGNPYFADRDTVVGLGADVHILTEEELKLLGNTSLREYRPKRNYLRIGR